MAYTVLARKYRSQVFDDVLGQEAVSKTLKNAISSGRVAHAYLFSGTRGVGKTTMARILAKSLNCLNSEQPTTEPCCKCDSCLSINLGEDIDVIEIDGASNNGVENIRELRENAIYKPARARYKIYIIDEIHMLSTGAFNALLKILEEPPAHVKFIFATTEPNKVLSTIQSRCQRFDFCNISPEIIAKQIETVLDAEKIKYEPDLIIRLSRLANGSMRDALSLLDQLISAESKKLTTDLIEKVLGQPDTLRIYTLIEKIASADAPGVITGVDELLASGITANQVLESLIARLRDIMILKTAPNSKLVVLTGAESEQVNKLLPDFDIPGLIYSVTALEKLRWTIKNSENPRPLLEATMLRLALSEHFLSVTELMGQISSGSPATASALKKKSPAAEKRTPNPPLISQTQAQSVTSPPAGQKVNNVDPESFNSIKTNWQQIIDSTRNANGSTASYLASAEPASMNESILTIAFPKSKQFPRQMCEKRIDKVNELLSAALGKEIKTKFTTSADTDDKKTKTPAPGAKIGKKTRNKALQDPAVQTLLSGLDASVIDIREIDK